MRHWRRNLVGVSILLGLAATIGLRLLLAETNLDRNQGDYRSRMHAIWSGPAPGSLDPKRLSLDLDSGLLSHLFVNQLDGEVPYLVAFPASGASPAPALLLLPVPTAITFILTASFSIRTISHNLGIIPCLKNITGNAYFLI